ncbi:hypothetical protein EYF80_017283 [Liparis tanakae]|uniref:Uncharacterized protein n=1 Tax=Liparis tanakae TaxID=230148 RepID=A0A4Z2I3E9_9TELE|nr:hypothetical protein EYF80_017283 [Liparis tanakae]
MSNIVGVLPRHRDLWPSQQQLESPQPSLLSSSCRALQPPKQRGADPDHLANVIVAIIILRLTTLLFPHQLLRQFHALIANQLQPQEAVLVLLVPDRAMKRPSVQHVISEAQEDHATDGQKCTNQLHKLNPPKRRQQHREKS